MWDGFVRVFHWGVVIFFFISYFEIHNAYIHENAGYVVLALVALRVVWGFVGPEHARFKSFVRRPSAAFRYLLDLPRGRAERSLGHNPAGGWMIIALLFMLTVASGSGMLMITDRFWGDPLVEDIHYLSADITVALVVLHVAGVIASSLAHRENLVLAMFTGRKRLDPRTAPAAETGAEPVAPPAPAVAHNPQPRPK